MWKAIARKDWQEVDRHLAPLFVGVSAGGRVLDRTGWLDYWKGQGVEEALLSELQTRPSGQDMVVTFVLQLSGTTPVAVDAKQMYRVISVWQQVKSGWILTTTSMIPVTPQ
jgi:ketosteroid isomerase-like protein